MNRDDIYDHLAQVYLGKKNKSEQKRKKQFTSWLVINIVITGIIFASSVYGLTAFLTHRGDPFPSKVIYTLNNGPIRISYNLEYPFPPVKTFSLSVPEMNVAKYHELQFAVRGLEEGSPGIIRVEVRNRRNEVSSVFVKNIEFKWERIQIPFEKFEHISDWSDISEISFVIESWNAEDKDGIILIDDVCFST
jgi:hypothetical protein